MEPDPDLAATGPDPQSDPLATGPDPQSDPALGGGPHPELVSSAAHVFVQSVDEPVLSEHDMAHLVGSLRLRDGESVTVSDGASQWRRCTFRGNGVLVPAGPVHRRVPSPTVGVAFCLTGSSSAREVATKLCEVGVDLIVPMVSERCTSRWEGEKSARLVEGLRRVVREAAMQSRRVSVPSVDKVRTFPEVVAEWAGSAWLADPSGGVWLGVDRDPGRLSVLIGPEGGWSPEERAGGLPCRGMGTTVLRAETAAVVAGALLCRQRDWLTVSGTSAAGAHRFPHKG